MDTPETKHTFAEKLIWSIYSSLCGWTDCPGASAGGLILSTAQSMQETLQHTDCAIIQNFGIAHIISY